MRSNILLHLYFSGVGDNGSLPIQEALNDSLRLNYHHSHLSNLLKAIRWVTMHIVLEKNFPLM